MEWLGVAGTARSGEMQCVTDEHGRPGKAQLGPVLIGRDRRARVWQRRCGRKGVDWEGLVCRCRHGRVRHGQVKLAWKVKVRCDEVKNSTLMLGPATIMAAGFRLSPAAVLFY